MERILLVRHAEPIGKQSSAPLTEQGKWQAGTTGSQIRRSVGERHVAALLAGTSRRATQTAEHIGIWLPATPIVARNEALGERLQFQEGMDADAFNALWEAALLCPHAVPPEGKSAVQAGRGFMAALDAYQTKRINTGESTLVVVSNAGTIEAVVNEVFTLDEIEAAKPGFSTIRDWRSKKPLAILSDMLPHASITEMRRDDSHIELVSVGSTAHLSGSNHKS